MVEVEALEALVDTVAWDGEEVLAVALEDGVTAAVAGISNAGEVCGL